MIVYQIFRRGDKAARPIATCSSDLEAIERRREMCDALHLPQNEFTIEKLFGFDSEQVINLIT
jgi:hypothetical protein